MENKDYGLGSIVIMKKQHPCGTNEWEIVRVGADIKIKIFQIQTILHQPTEVFQFDQFQIHHTFLLKPLN